MRWSLSGLTLIYAKTESRTPSCADPRTPPRRIARRHTSSECSSFRREGVSRLHRSGRAARSLARRMASQRSRPPRQAAVLAVRKDGADVNVCLIRKKSSGAWGIPKGSIDPGYTREETALNEAWEEAGIRGRSSATRLAPMSTQSSAPASRSPSMSCALSRNYQPGRRCGRESVDGPRSTKRLQR